METFYTLDHFYDFIIYKTKRLDQKIYYWYNRPDYDAEVK